jgi:hypothetical protein
VVFRTPRRLLAAGYSVFIYRLLADAIAAFHLAYAAFVALGLATILLGGLRRWSWVRNFWFRAVHLAMIAAVVFEVIFNIYCPLTAWEDALREKAGENVQAGTFIGRLVDNVLFVDVPAKILDVIYCLFGLAVLIAIFCIPPRRPAWRRSRES